MSSASRDRALGAFYGLAIGDALGMPTQQLPRDVVERSFGTIDRFRDGPPENFISAGMPAATITDDTEQTLVLGEILVRGEGRVDRQRFAERLRAWERVANARGGEQLGPSTRRALDALAAGASVDEAGRRGDTNGAAMRITPVGVAVEPRPVTRLVDMVEAASALTHHTGMAISGAAAVATVVSVGVDGGVLAEAVPLACEAADVGLTRGGYSAGARVRRRIELGVELAASAPSDAAFITEVSDLIGTGVATQESVPAAFAIASRWPEDPWAACCTAASLGGDTDTIGAMVGAMLGATVGVDGLRRDAVERVRAVNGFHPEELVDGLLGLRGASDTDQATREGVD